MAPCGARAQFATLYFLSALPACLYASSIFETLGTQGQFTTLKAALERTRLNEALAGEGPFTVFAPSDDAFSALLAKLGATADELLNRRDLAQILKVHVASGKTLSSELNNGDLVQTLEGARMKVTIDGAVKIGTSSVTEADLDCSNGVIHIIDAVLLPPNRLRVAGGSTWDEQDWNVQVDGVMGGRSTGSIRFDGGALTFSGNINLNGGGFSTARRQIDTLDLSGYAGFLLEMSTEPYVRAVAPLGVHLNVVSRSSSYSHAAAFAIPMSETEERVQFFIPFSTINRASRWGRTCSSCRLDTSRVRGIELSVLFQEGPFAMKLHKVSAVRRALDAPFVALPVIRLESSTAIADLIRSTISSGASLYDKSYQELCIAVYTTTTRAILSATGVPAATRAIACAGLVRASRGESTSKAERAWVLRRTFDAILADVEGKARPNDGRYPPNVLGAWLPGRAAAETASASCAAAQDVDATGYAGRGENVDSGVVATSCTDASESSSLAKYLGPFKQMGITGNNNFGLVRASSPGDCARRCLCQKGCRSFDYGARGGVTGECWMSLANRASVGAAYTRWPLYDYYELDTGDGDVSGNIGRSDDTPSKGDGDVSGRIGRGEDTPSTGDADVSGNVGRGEDTSSKGDGGNARAATSPSDSLGEFEGPFYQMGISGYNDFALYRASSPEDCAQQCLRRDNCRSFDYGARGSVVGECWMSRADRASVGTAYRRWTLYDYYERRESGSISMSPTSAQNAFSNPWLWAMLAAGVVIFVLVGVIITVCCRLQKSRAVHFPSDMHVVRGQAEENSQEVVVGKPVSREPVVPVYREPVVVRVPSPASTDGKARPNEMMGV